MNTNQLQIKIAEIAINNQHKNPFISKSEQFKLLVNCDKASLLTARVEKLIKKHSCFEGITDLITAKNYRPTLYTNSARTTQDRIELKLIADYYDAFMQSNNIDKKAYRV